MSRYPLLFGLFGVEPGCTSRALTAGKTPRPGERHEMNFYKVAIVLATISIREFSSIISVRCARKAAFSLTLRLNRVRSRVIQKQTARSPLKMNSNTFPQLGILRDSIPVIPRSYSPSGTALFLFGGYPTLYRGVTREYSCQLSKAIPVSQSCLVLLLHRNYLGCFVAPISVLPSWHP